MKAKTRFLAMLLTLLMVVGLLPLSLFALDETLPAGQSIEGIKERDLDYIKAEFNKHNMTLGVYQSFDNFATEDIESLKDGSWQVHFNSANSAYADHVDSVSVFSVANHKKAFTVVDDNGNKALYLGNAVLPDNPQDGVDYKNNYENYLNFKGVDAKTETALRIFISVWT